MLLPLLDRAFAPTRIVALVAGLALVAGACSSGSSADTEAPITTVSAPPAVEQGDIAGTFDIGGRSIYMQCTGQGSPTVILISGGGIAADLWDSPLGEQPTVYPTVAKTNRVCAYDRPGTTRAIEGGGFSRSDPVPQPVTPSRSAAELHALLEVSGQNGPFVLAAHSYGGLVARYFAHQYPTEVAGMVLVDSFSPELREAMPELWPAWIAWNTTPPAVIEDYPDYERVDFDEALDEVVANRAIPPMPLVVLTADKPYPSPTQPGLPADINIVTREAQDVSQRLVAQLVPGAQHITNTDSGHDIMLENPVLVSDAILDVVAAVQDGRTTTTAEHDVTGSIDIGGGRELYLECRGSGSPTVVLVSGTQGAHDDWTHVAAAQPAAAPQATESAVFPQVARFTRVCAYDRPGTTLLSAAPSPSDPVPQPTTAQQGVADLAALLEAADEPGPYVLVGASWGGMIVNLFARSHPADVSGLVFVDGASEFLNETLTPEQWTAWMQLNQTMVSSADVEVPDYDATIDEISAAPGMPAVPAVVLSAENPWNLPLGDAGATWPAWTAAQDRLASLLAATHVTDTNSGHPINIEQPGVVTDAIREVVDAAR